jgi:hypothetical protein
MSGDAADDPGALANDLQRADQWDEAYVAAAATLAKQKAFLELLEALGVVAAETGASLLLGPSGSTIVADIAAAFTKATTPAATTQTPAKPTSG